MKTYVIPNMLPEHKHTFVQKYSISVSYFCMLNTVHSVLYFQWIVVVQQWASVKSDMPFVFVFVFVFVVQRWPILSACDVWHAFCLRLAPVISCLGVLLWGLLDGKNRTESNYGENYARKHVEHHTMIICVYTTWMYIDECICIFVRICK